MPEQSTPTHSLSKDFYAIPISDFFKIATSVDCVIFGHDGVELTVLLIQRGADPFHGYWALPGDLVYPQEDLDFAAMRVLRDLTHVENVHVEQVGVFGAPDRHPIGRVITTAYLALVEMKDFTPTASSWATKADWHSVKDLPQLAFDHEDIITSALDRLRETARHKPIGRGVLSEKFTITELQELYEAIYDIKLDKGNFRKKLNEWDHLLDLKEFQKNVSHRPARIYAFCQDRYEELERKGFSFEL